MTLTVLAAKKCSTQNDIDKLSMSPYLERDHLGSAQARAVSNAQRRLVIEPGRRVEQLCATSSELSTTGSLRGSWMNVVRLRSP